MPMYPPPPPGLSRYGSAPGSLLASIAESVVAGGGSGGEIPAAGSGGGGAMSRFYVSADSSTLTPAPPRPEPNQSIHGSAAAAAAASGGPRFQPPAYCPSEISAAASGGGAPLLRHSSSPAGFFSHLMVDQGFSGGPYLLASTTLKPHWSFSGQETLSHISEISSPDIGDRISTCNNSSKGAGNIGHTYAPADLPVNTWSDSILFSAPSTKQIKDDEGDFLTNLNSLESQTSLEMASIENFLQTQQDSAPCKVRAKRGCATHPRSIAERERRTRISKKLRKLQDLVPNMDKQTNTSDMLELAVHYIKELQVQVQKLNQEQANCTCASKQEI